MVLRHNSALWRRDVSRGEIGSLPESERWGEDLRHPCHVAKVLWSQPLPKPVDRLAVPSQFCLRSYWRLLSWKHDIPGIWIDALEAIHASTKVATSGETEWVACLNTSPRNNSIWLNPSPEDDSGDKLGYPIFVCRVVRILCSVLRRQKLEEFPLKSVRPRLNDT